jgi:hypothetical protein
MIEQVLGADGTRLCWRKTAQSCQNTPVAIGGIRISDSSELEHAEASWRKIRPRVTATYMFLLGMQPAWGKRTNAMKLQGTVDSAREQRVVVCV